MKLLLSILSLFSCMGLKATNYYFSSLSGDDTRTSTQAQNVATPWKTTTKFNSFFASLAPGDSCLFRRGETYCGFLIISRSGTVALPIIIGAYGSGAKPIISGLSTVLAWTSSGGGIYTSTSAVTTSTTLNLVTFQGNIQPMGRWPKATATNGGYLTNQTHTGSSSLTSNAISGALNYVGGEIVSRKYPWILDRARITNQTSTTVTSIPLVSPLHPTFTYDFFNDHGFFFQNHINACTVLGEWAYDSVNHKIQMYFGANDPALYTVKVSAKDTLVTITSRSYITFDNIKFIGSNSKTFNIHVCDHIKINNCDFDFAGTNAIYIINSVSNNIMIYGCNVSNTNNNAISSNGATSMVIQNNIIKNTATIIGSGQSGDGQYNAMSYIGDNSLVEYNRIINTGYIGVHFFGNSSIVKNNFIDSFCMVKTDGGAIYTYSNRTNVGRKVIGNICVNGIGDRYGLGASVLYAANPYAGETVGIYMDGGAKDVEIIGNTVANCDGTGLQLGSSQDMIIDSNTFYNNRTSQIDALDSEFPLSNLTIKHNVLFSKLSDQLIMSVDMRTVGSNYLSTMGNIDSNYYCRPIYEPDNINGVTGYSHGTDWSFPYNDGGIVRFYAGGPSSSFYSLDKWKIFSGKDAATVKTYATIIDTSKIRFEYNATNVTVTVNLNGITYRGITGATYTGSVNIAPYSSLILLNPVPDVVPCSANAGADITINRGDLPVAYLNGSGSTGANLTYTWRRITTVNPSGVGYKIKHATSQKAEVFWAIYNSVPVQYELTVNNGAGCTSKDTVSIITTWNGGSTPQSADATGWHTAVSGDVSAIGAQCRVGDIVISGARTNSIEGLNRDINITDPQWAITPGKRIFIKGGIYRKIVIIFTGTNTATQASRAIITNYSGQVEAQNWHFSNLKNVLITGEYVANVSGDASYRGHASGAYAFSRGKYGLFENNRWQNSDGWGVQTSGVNTDSVEYRFWEFGNGNFGMLNMKQDAGGAANDWDGMKISNCYFHNGNGELMYLGQTTGSGHHQFNGMIIENCRIAYGGNENIQFNQQAKYNVIRNNVSIAAGMRRASAFGAEQDRGYQWAFVNSGNRYINNIQMGSNQVITGSGSNDPGGVTQLQDTNHIANNFFSHGAGGYGGYHSSVMTGEKFRFDSNYIVKEFSRGSQIYVPTWYDASNQNLWLQIPNASRTVFRKNISDGTKTNLTNASNLDSSGNIKNAGTVLSPVFVNSGWANEFDFTLLIDWVDSVYWTYGDESSTPGGAIKWGTTNNPSTAPLYVFQAGDYVMLFGKTYKSLQNNNSNHVPQLTTDAWWEKQTWSDGVTTYDYPPDDYRQYQGSTYQARNIGLTDYVAGNINPTVNAGTDISITLPTSSAGLAALGADADGTIVSYAWTNFSGPASGTISTPNSATTSVTGLVQGVYVFRVTVTDNQGGTGTDDVQVTVNAAPANQPPSSNAGTDKTIILPINTVAQVGTGTDPDGTVTNYLWTQISGPNTGLITSPTSSATNFSTLIAGTYIFELKVTDNGGLTNSDAVTITVLPNPPPVADAGPDRNITLPTSTTTLNGSATDNISVSSYAWTKQSGPATGTIVSPSSAVTNLNGLVEGTYVFRLTATDNGGATGTDMVTVIVNPAPPANNPPISIPGANRSIILPQNSITQVGSGTDNDGSVVAYLWTQVNAGPNTAGISAATSSTTDFTGLIAGTYIFNLRVQDDDGDFGNNTFTLTVSPNPPPIANAGLDKNITLPTNSTLLDGSASSDNVIISSYLWTKTSGPSTYTITSPTASITTITGLVEGTYTFQLLVTDNGGLTSTDIVFVIVNPSNAPNNIFPTANAGADQQINTPLSTVTLNGNQSTDVDGSISLYQWTKVAGPTFFTILSPLAAATSFSNLVAGTYLVELQVTDNKGDIDKDTVTILVNATPSVNAGIDRTLIRPQDSLNVAAIAGDLDGTIISYLWEKISGEGGIISNPTSASTSIVGLQAGVYVFRVTVTDDKGAISYDDITVYVYNSATDFLRTNRQFFQ